MECLKKKRRDILGIFDDYQCDKCKNFLSDEEILIGNYKIKIYYLIDSCRYMDYNFMYGNKKTRLLFKDIYIDRLKNPKNNNIFLWLDKTDNFYKYYDEFTYFLEHGFNIIIIS